jgi:hypothetical protein
MCIEGSLPRPHIRLARSPLNFHTHLVQVLTPIIKCHIDLVLHIITIQCYILANISHTSFD